jgi:hypothetical protein
VLGHAAAVDAVVGGHHRPRACPSDDRLEGGQVELAQGALVHQHVDGEAFRVGVVGHEVLGHGGDPALLDAGDELDGDLRGEQGILRVALEVPAAERAAVQVDGRREQHVHALAPGLLREQLARPPGDAGVPRGCERRRAGQGDRAAVRAPMGTADPDRTVRHDQRAQPDLGQRREGPHVETVDEADLVVEIEAGERRLDGGCARGLSGSAGGRHGLRMNPAGTAPRSPDWSHERHGQREISADA